MFISYITKINIKHRITREKLFIQSEFETFQSRCGKGLPWKTNQLLNSRVLENRQNKLNINKTSVTNISKMWSSSKVKELGEKRFYKSTEVGKIRVIENERDHIGLLAGAKSQETTIKAFKTSNLTLKIEIKTCEIFTFLTTEASNTGRIG